MNKNETKLINEIIHDLQELYEKILDSNIEIELKLALKKWINKIPVKEKEVK